ncbi:MAG: SDR family oxidoreductase [Actinomycetia bacterium]|nr:SDR family oxidoreductase [Actinomycetes bacterium]
MDLNLEGKTALVTGASSGLGLGCARALASEGARVVMVSRSIEKLTAAAESVPGAAVMTADVSNDSDRTAMLDRVADEVGQVDILIANAGGPPPGNFASTDVSAYRPAVDLNMMPTIDMCKRLVPAMQQAGWGRVVAITSMSVREPMAQLILSNTARAGLTAFLKTLSREVAGDGITVNSLQPGLHATARLTDLYDDLGPLATAVPTKKLGDADDFGRVAAFLCSDSAQFITGAAIPLDGGAGHGLQ